MKVRFLGHAAFSVQVADLRLCLDPHRPGAVGGKLQLPPIRGPFDAVLVSHRHDDHCGWTAALGSRHIIDRDTTVGGVTCRFRVVPHDDQGGARMGFSRMMSLEHGGFRLVHAGDIGAVNDDDRAWLAGTDLLLVPVGGTFTIDGPAAAKLVAAVKPRWVTPMHAADPRVDLPLAPIEPFIVAAGRATVTVASFDSDLPPDEGTCVLLSSP